MTEIKTKLQLGLDALRDGQDRERVIEALALFQAVLDNIIAWNAAAAGPLRELLDVPPDALSAELRPALTAIQDGARWLLRDEAAEVVP